MPGIAYYSSPRVNQCDASGGQLLHCGERLITDDDAVRISIARRSAFKRLPAFKRLATSIRLGFLELLAIREPGIVILPPGPGAAPSSRESNCPLSLTLITLPVLLPLVVVPPDVTVVGALVLPNGGALLSG